MGHAEYRIPEGARDDAVSVQTLREAVTQFNGDRGWTGLNAVNLAMSINIEASELLEIFQWCDPQEADEKARVTEREHFREELADVLQYGSADVYVVRLAEGSVSFPALKEVVREIDAENGVIRLDGSMFERTAVYNA